jgi:hypothetical protein
VLPPFLPIILSILALLSLCIGIAGLAAGATTVRASGENTLMHYPAPAAWLRSRLTAAKWVVWIGRLYLMAALGLGTAAFMVGLSPDDTDSAHRSCVPIARAILSANWTGSTWTAHPKETHAGGCQLVILDHKQTRWFSVQSAPIDGLIGEGFSLRSAKLERAGLTLSPIPGLGRRAILATDETRSTANPALLYEDLHATTIIEMNRQTVDSHHFDLIVNAIRRSQPNDGGFSM